MENSNLNLSATPIHPATAPTPNAPTGVKVLSILVYVASGIQIALSLLVSLMGAWIINLLTSNGIAELGFSTESSVVTVVLGILSAGLGVFGIFVARGLWRLHNWARLMTILFFSINILACFAYLIVLQPWTLSVWVTFISALPIFINALLLWYLFSTKVKASFQAESSKIFTNAFVLALMTLACLVTAISGGLVLLTQQTSKEITKAISQVAPKSALDCKEATSDFIRDNCYINLANSTKDFSYCDQITPGEAGATWKANCYALKVGVDKDLNACRATFYKDGQFDICVSSGASNFGIANKDKADCEIFTQPSQELLDLYLQKYNWDRDIMISITNDWKKSCVESVEKENPNPI